MASSSQVGHIHKFLTLAEPLLSARVELDEADWNTLRQLARQTDVTERELQEIIDQLCRRGVLRRGPPRAARSAAPEHSSTINQRSAEISWDARTGRMILPTADSGLAAAGGLPGRAQPPQAANAHAEQPATGPGPNEVEQFLQQARAILAQRQGLDRHAYLLLTDIAHSLGLSEEQFDDLLLRVADFAAAEESARAQVPQPGGGRDVQPPAWQRPVCPQETFRRYLRIALADKQQTRGYVSARAARKIVEQGVTKLGLSPVYARHLLEEEAQALQVKLLAPRASSSQEQSREDDAALEEFLERAAPILARERGLTPQAQVLLSAIASEVGLSEEQWRAAWSNLIAGPRDADARQHERVAAFESFLQTALASLADVVSPVLLEDLLWRGEQLYGLERRQARSCIDAVARRRNMVVLDEKAALDYLRAEIQDRIERDGRLRSAERVRLLNLAVRWGIAEAKVHSAMQAAIAERHRHKRHTILLALVALACMVTGTALFLNSFWPDVLVLQSDQLAGWGRGSTAEQPLNERSDNDRGLTSPTHARANESRWEWSVDVQLLIATAARGAPATVRAALERLQSADVSERSAAYEVLVPEAVEQACKDEVLSPLAQLVAHCAVWEPDDRTRRQVWQLLEEAALAESQNLDTDAPNWRFRGAVRLMLASTNVTGQQPARMAALARINELYGTALSLAIQPSLREATVWEKAVSQWVERLARRASSWDAARTRQAWQSLEPLVRKWVPSSRRSELLVTFLHQALPAAGAQAELYTELVNEVLGSGAPGVLDRVYQAVVRVSDESVRARFLRSIAERLGERVDRKATADELARLVRVRLGLAEEPKEDWPEKRRQWNVQVGYALASDLPPSRRPRLVDAIRLRSSLHWQGLAIWKQHADAYRDASEEWKRMFETPPEEPAEKTTDGSADLRAAVSVEATPAAEQAAIGIYNLTRFQNRNDRVLCVELLARMAEVVPEITPRSARQLADYLMDLGQTEKRAEREKVLPLVHRFGHWNNLRLALATELIRRAVWDEHAQQLWAALYGHASKEAMGPELSAEAVSLKLLDESLAVLAERLSVAVRPEDDPLALLQDSLTRHWRARQALLGIAEDDRKEAGATLYLRDSLSEAVRQLASRPELPSAIAAGLKDLKLQLEIIDFVSDSDLERAVRLEQLWLQVLGWHVDLKCRDGSGSRRVQEVLRRKATDLLEQLFYLEGEALALLQVLTDESLL